MTVSVTATVYRKIAGPRNLPAMDTSGPGATYGGAVGDELPMVEKELCRYSIPGNRTT